MRTISVVAVCSALILFKSPAGLSGQDHDHGEHAGSSFDSPYTDLVNREIKALSDAEITSLLEGEGMGFALPAELNGFPGPRHVLELAAELELTEAQTREVDAIMSAMSEEARHLGERIVEAERALDVAFSSHTITTEELARATAEIAELRGRLRAAHLGAHLETTALLTMRQRHQYQVRRGYVR